MRGHSGLHSCAISKNLPWTIGLPLCFRNSSDLPTKAALPTEAGIVSMRRPYTNTDFRSGIFYTQISTCLIHRILLYYRSVCLVSSISWWSDVKSGNWTQTNKTQSDPRYWRLRYKEARRRLSSYCSIKAQMSTHSWVDILAAHWQQPYVKAMRRLSGCCSIKAQMSTHSWVEVMAAHWQQPDGEVMAADWQQQQMKARRRLSGCCSIKAQMSTHSWVEVMAAHWQQQQHIEAMWRLSGYCSRTAPMLTVEVVITALCQTPLHFMVSPIFYGCCTSSTMWTDGSPTIKVELRSTLLREAGRK